jgi:hypothetical protein
MTRPSTPQPAASLAQRLGAFVRRVVGVVAPRTRRAPAVPVAPEAAPAGTKQWISGWVRTRCAALSALMARIESGTLRPSARTVRRTASVGIAPCARHIAPVAPQFGWVCRWAPETHWAGGPVRDLLEGARVRSLVLAAPERMVRAWSPLLNALGQERPEWFPVLPKRARMSRKKDASVARETVDDDTLQIEATFPACATSPSLPCRNDGDVAGDRRVRPGDDFYQPGAGGFLPGGDGCLGVMTLSDMVSASDTAWPRRDFPKLRLAGDLEKNDPVVTIS